MDMYLTPDVIIIYFTLQIFIRQKTFCVLYKLLLIKWHQVTHALAI